MNSNRKLVRYYRNRLRQKILVRLANKPWRTWWTTLVGGIAIGAAAAYFFLNYVR